MDFNFSDDQEQLRDAVRKWVDKGYDFERRRKAVEAGGFDRSVWNELAELGLAGLYIPEADGGMGMGPVEGMVVMEELGRGMVLEPLNQALIAGGVLSGYAPDALKTEWLPRIAAGDALVVLASQERRARYRLDVCDAKATQSSVGWSLTATKNVVPVGDQADAFLVPATVNGAVALFLVARGASGVSTRGYGTQDGGRAADLILQNAPASLITTDGLAALELAEDIGIAATCAEAVGVMDKTVDLTAEYLNTRKQFGVPIGSFQAVKHRLADGYMQLERARALGYFAAACLAEDDPRRAEATAMAKAAAGDCQRFVAGEGIQLLGGIGFTWEQDQHLWVKRAMTGDALFGRIRDHRARLAEILQPAG